MTKVCYLTSKRVDDIRVFYKESISLVKYGYDVCIVAQNTENTIKSGIEIRSVSTKRNDFFYRNFLLPRLLYKEALKINADIYHFHDPGLLPYIKKLKKNKKKIIVDFFEDHPTLLFEKKNIPQFIIKSLSVLYSLYEKRKCRYADGIICCYHWTYDRLKTACNNIQLVFNFPIIKNTLQPHLFNQGKSCVLCYTGLISHIWNIENLIKTLPKTNTTLNLAGNVSENYFKSISSLEGWAKVRFMGMLPKKELKQLVFDHSDIGIALLGYIPLCKGKVGNMSNNKMFEYMMEGLPIICTDFTLWKEIVEQNNCGICVNPYNIEEIAHAINYLATHKDVAEEMGKNGQKIIMDEYNWSTQEIKLLEVYKSLK